MATNKPANVSSKIWASLGDVEAPTDAKMETGWVAEVPKAQVENWVQNRQDAFNAHVNERGIAEWDATTDYIANKSYVQDSSGTVYRAVQNTGPSTVVQNPTTDGTNTYWVVAFAGGSLDVYTKGQADARFVKNSELPDASAIPGRLAALEQFDADLAGATGPGNGAAMVAYASRSVGDKLAESVSFFDYMTSAEIADAKSGSPVLDHYAAIQQCLNDAPPGAEILINPDGVFRTTQKLSRTTRCRLVVAGTLLGDFSEPQALLEFSTGPQPVGVPVYYEPPSTLAGVSVHFAGGTLDWGMDNTDFVYVYGDVKPWWTYCTLFMDRCTDVEITGAGTVRRGLVSSLFIRRAQDVTVDARLHIRDTVWDNGFSVSSVVNTTGLNDGTDPSLWNRVRIKGLVCYNNRAFGANAFDCIDVVFEDCIAFENGNGYSVETPGYSRTRNSRVKFKNCKAIGHSLGNAEDFLYGAGFYVDGSGTEIDASCVADGNYRNIVVSVSRDVILDGDFRGAVLDNIVVAQGVADPLLSPEVTVGSNARIRAAGGWGLTARGCNRITICDGAEITGNAVGPININNSGGAAYNQGGGVVTIGSATVRGNGAGMLGAEYVAEFHMLNTLITSGAATGVYVDHVGLARLMHLSVHDSGLGALSGTGGLAVFLGPYVTLGHVAGLITDAESPLSNQSVGKVGMTNEGVADSTATDIPGVVSGLNLVISRLRAAGVINS